MPKKKKVAKARTSLFQEQGVTGVKTQGGRLYEEFLKDLQGEKGQKIYREMADNHPIIGATRHVFGVLGKGGQIGCEGEAGTPLEKTAAIHETHRGVLFNALRASIFG